MKGLRAKIDYILKHNRVFNKCFIFCASMFFRFIGLFIPVDNKAVIFSGHGRKYNDSPKAIFEYMISRPEFSTYRFYWALEDTDNTDIPGECIKIKSDTFKYFITTLKCKYWITCVNIERGLRYKKRNTVYLNTWHGIPIKTVGNCAGQRRDYDFSYINHFCISGEYETDIYFNSFNIKPESTIKSGMPRNDTLYKTTDEEVAKLKEKIGLPKDKKILLYAPTWRDSLDKGKSYKIAPPIDLEMWKKELENEYILLFRTHPYTNELLGVEFNDFVRDYTNYPDINDLLKISDVLISDYSATIFDYAILERPIICFAYDCDEYSRERGFAMDIKAQMPEGIVENETELINKLKNLDYNDSAAKVREFKNKYLQYGGNATQICVETIFGIKE